MKSAPAVLAAYDAVLELLEQEGCRAERTFVCKGAVEVAMRAGLVSDAVKWSERAAEYLTVCFGGHRQSVKKFQQLIEQLRASSEA
jgi:hypothetical protein